jgi:hypothetical protein
LLDRTLLDCGMLAGPVFVGTFTLLGRRRSDYSRRRDPVSALALGPEGFVQTLNFAATGLLTCKAAWGLHRSSGRGQSLPSRAVPGLVAAAGVGFLCAGIFPTDPVPPPDSPQEPLTPTGTLHIASAFPVFLCLPLACLLSVTDRPETRRMLIGASTAVVSVAAATMAGSGFRRPRQGRWTETAGLCQRVALVTSLGWLALHSRRVRSSLFVES